MAGLPTSFRPILTNRPLYRTAWRRLRRRPLEYVLFVLGIALGVAMMVSIDLANGSASRAFALATDAVAGKTTHRLVGSSAGFDDALYTTLRTEVGFDAAAPVVEGTVASPAIGDIPLRLVGVDPFAEPPFRTYLGGSGGGLGDGALAFLTTAGGVLVSAETAATHNLALNQTLTLDIAGRTHPVTLVGVIDAADELTRRGIADVIFADIATAQELLGMTGKLSRIDLIAADDSALAPVRAVLPPAVRLESAAAQGNAIQQMTAAFELNLTALSLLALVVGMFLIYNTVTFSVVQRRPLFGILRCLGVTGGQLTTLILAEAFVLGLVGSLLGLALGVVLGQAMVGLVTQTINDLYFVVNVRAVSVPPFTLVKGLLIGVAAALLASLPPALEARRTAPTSTLRRSTIERSVLTLLPRLALAAVVIAAIGVVLLAWDAGLVPALAGIFAVLFACALVTPLVTVWLMRLAQPVGDRLIGVLGRLAPRDIVRSLSRTSVAIAALMTAVSVIIGVSVMVGSFRLTVVQWLDQTLQADIYISPPGFSAGDRSATLDPALVAQAAAWPGVSRSATARHLTVAAPEWGRTVELLAISDDVSQGDRPFLWTDGDAATVVDRLRAGEGVIISEPLLRKQDLALPPAPVTLTTADGPRTYPVLAVFYDYASEQGVVWIGRDLYEAHWGDTAVSTVALFAAPGTDVDGLVNALRAELGAVQRVTIQSNDGLRQGSLEVFDRTFAITAALRLLATVVAFIGVLSALMSLQLERARELGTLRATGMTTGQLWRLTLLETGLMGGTAGVLAMPTGLILAWVLIHIINLRSFGWTLQMHLEPGYFVNAFLVAVVAALLAGVYPALRLGRMAIAAAVRSD